MTKATGVLATCAVVCASIGIAQPARAGGFGLSVELPGSSVQSATQEEGAVLIIRAVGCHGLGAAVSAKAEGLVDGERVSLPVKLEHLGNDTYALKRQWPSRGAWVVSLSAKSFHTINLAGKQVRPVTNALVEFAPDGSVKNVQDVAATRFTEARQVVRVRYIKSINKAQTLASVLQGLATQTASGPVVSTR